MKKRVVAIIPARMGASRFHGKPLVKILDLPMLEHVRRRVLLSEIFDSVYVATCDHEIMEMVQRFGGNVVMTANTHERCTERVEEASKSVDADIIAIIQGDEPLFIPAVLTELVQPLLENDNVCCVSLLSVIYDKNDLDDIDIVKTVLDVDKNIMYFSRSPIPYFRANNNATCYRQTGISAFTKEFLSRYISLPPTPLEIAESIDFLRILQHGYKIKGAIIGDRTFGVDREEDIRIIEEQLKNDPVQKRLYKRILEV